MTHCELVLQALRDGEWHTTSELYREINQPMILHSRISDLRKQGHNVEGRHVPGKTGADGYQYRLLPSVIYVDVPRTRPSDDTPSPCVPAAEQLTLTGVPEVVSVGPGYYDL